MPFFTPEENTLDYRGVTGSAPAIPDAPSADALGAAAFRQDNTVVSTITALRNSGPFTPDPSHNPLDIPGFRDSTYERDYLNRFAGSRSEPETRSIMSRIDQERADDKTLEAGGIGGAVLRMMAGTLDPTIALPTGVVVDASKAGLTFARAAVRTGAAGAAQSGLQEAALQASQETRSPTGSVLNVGSATILSALLGGAAAKLLSPVEHGAAVASLDKARADMDAHAGNIGTAAPAGAAISDTRILEPVPYGLDQIPGVGRASQQIDPMSRLISSDSVAARRAAVDLAETPLRFKENLEGVATSAGPSIERLAKMAIDQTRVNTTGELDRLFAEYRFGNSDVSVPRLRSQFEQFRGKGEGYMTFDAFKQEIAKAMTEGDKSSNPFVEQAAQYVRNTVFEPWKDRAIKAGLLPENVDVKTADSYFMRVYNKQAIAARRPEFVDRVTEFLKGDQATKADAKQRLDWMSAQLNSWEAQIAKLDARAGRAADKADVLGNRAAERGGEVVRTLDRAETLHERHARIAGEASDLRDAIDLMQEIHRANPTLSPVLGRTVDQFERRFATARVEKARTSEAASAARANEARLNILQDALSKNENRAALIDGMRQTAHQIRDEIRGKIEAEIEAWQGHSTTEARSALRARAKASEGRAPDAGRLGSADSAIDVAVRRILDSDRNLTDQELRDLAHEVTQRILGSPDGRLAYEAGSSGHGVSSDARGPLAARVFNIPDATIRDFLEQDVEHIIHTHLRTMVPDVLLAERFGDVNMTESFRKIEDEFSRLTDAAKSEKARSALNKQRENAIRDLAAIRDRIRGTYGSSFYSIMPNAARIAAGIKNYNVIANLGMAAISSLPDMAGVVFRHGLSTTFRDAWVPFLRGMMRVDDGWSKAKTQIKAMGIANEALLATRHNAIADIIETYKPQSRVERTLQWGANRLQLVNMLGQWTDWAKTVSSMVAGAEILRATEAVTKGTATRRQIANLAEASIDGAMARRIHEQFKQAGAVEDGVHLANTSDWTDRGAREAYEGAMGREADIAVVTPGQEKPLWLSNPILGVLGQFKSFTAASTQRLLIANLQRRDAQVLQGLLFSLGTGMVSYKLNALLGGQKTSDRPQDWVKEAVSRGGLLGWIEESNALASKMTRGGVDLYRMIGSDKPLSRYAGRSVLDQMLGPTAGKIGSLAQITGAAGAREWNESDTNAVRRLIIGQNLFWLRGVLNEAQAGVNHAFGIPMKAAQ